MNSLAKAVRDYLALRRGLGFKLVRHEGQLQEFMSFLVRKHSSRTTVALALEWATLHAREKPADWAARLSVVRGFARYWSATDPSTEVPPLGLLPYRAARAQPYFYSEHEIRQLLAAAKARPSRDPLRCWTYYCLFGLLAVTGLRSGEALNLRTEDLDCYATRDRRSSNPACTDATATACAARAWQFRRVGNNRGPRQHLRRCRHAGSSTYQPTCLERGASYVIPAHFRAPTPTAGSSRSRHQPRVPSLSQNAHRYATLAHVPEERRTGRYWST